MATNTSPSTDPESAHWYDDDQELLGTVKTFHEFYAMSPEKLEKVKKFNEEKVLDKFLEYLGVCSEYKKIGGSYEGVKVVKSEEDDDFEFDVMFVWKIPEECPLKIVEISGRHGYALLQVENGHMNTAKENRSANHQFFAECLTFENDMCIVDAGKTISAFFSKLQKWINTGPVSGYKLLPRQHGTAIQVDVIPEQIGDNTVTHNKILYSVDIAPTFEFGEGDDAKRYVAKPEKKRTPDSVTWLRLFDSEENDSGLVQLARSSLQTAAVDELHKQRSEYQGSCAMLEARTRMPLPLDDIEKLQAALVGQVSSYRISLVNLQDLKKGKSMRIMAIAYFFDKELEVLSVPEKPGYVWLKLREETSVSSRFSDALKLCYLPGGKYLDIKAASDVLVKELREIVKHLFRDQVVIVRRDGPIVCIDVYPENGNTMLYYCLDIVLTAYVDGNYYIGLPHDYDDAQDKKAWRRSYSYEETTKIQEAPEGLKMVFRILKALRNGEPGLAQLTSYHFKSLLLNIQRKNTVNWNENIDKILIRVLHYLKVRLNKKKLKTYFIPEINLLENMTNDCSFHMISRIRKLLGNKEKMLKALKLPKKETTHDFTKLQKKESAQVFLESRFVPGFSCGFMESQLQTEIDKQLFGYDHLTITSKPVYEDLKAYRICQVEAEFPVNSYAIVIIHNNKNNLHAKQFNSKVIRLERRNSTVSNSLLQTVTHNSGLADTIKTAEYIKQQLEKQINKSSLLRSDVTIHLNGSNIVLKSNSNLRLDILPGYEVGERLFIAMPEVASTNAWIPLLFTPVRNRFWKAFKINECGRRVLSELREIRNREPVLAKLSERHLLMALFWEMETERDWSDDKVTERVHDVRERLLIYIKQKNLPNYFYPMINTL